MLWGWRGSCGAGVAITSPSPAQECRIYQARIPYSLMFNVIKARNCWACQLQNFSSRGTSALDAEYQHTSGVSRGFRSFGLEHLSPTSNPL